MHGKSPLRMWIHTSSELKNHPGNSFFNARRLIGIMDSNKCRKNWVRHGKPQLWTKMSQSTYETHWVFVLQSGIEYYTTISRPLHHHDGLLHIRIWSRLEPFRIPRQVIQFTLVQSCRFLYLVFCFETTRGMLRADLSEYHNDAFGWIHGVIVWRKRAKRSSYS